MNFFLKHSIPSMFLFNPGWNQRLPILMVLLEFKTLSTQERHFKCGKLPQ